MVACADDGCEIVASEKPRYDGERASCRGGLPAAAGGRRLCAVTEGPDGDAELAGLVAEVCLDGAVAEDESSGG